MSSPSESRLGAEDLFRSENLVVRRLAAANTDRWVVTFDHYGIGHGFDRPGFGEAWLQAQGISAIHVMGRAEDWYQYADMDEALAAVRSATRGARRVVTYGSSMGGYAAIRFAGAAGATHVLALSPQYSVDPRVAGHDTRWSQDVTRIRWRSEFNGSIVCPARGVIVYDPTGPDRWHGDRIQRESPLIPIRLPYTAHPVTTYLSEVGLLGALITGLLDDELDAAAFRAEARRRRGGSGVYLGELAVRQPGWRAGTALGLARKAVAVSPASPHARVSLGRLLSREGRHEEALSVLSAVVAESERTLTHVIDLAGALAASNQTTAARLLADEVLERTVDVAHLHAWAAQMCWLNGDFADARRLIRRAVALDPRNRNYLRGVADYHLGRPGRGTDRGIRVTPWLRLARWAVTLTLFRGRRRETHALGNSGSSDGVPTSGR